MRWFGTVYTPLMAVLGLLLIVLSFFTIPADKIDASIMLVSGAILAAGAVTVPIYETSSPDQIGWILSDSGAVAIVVETAEHTASVLRILRKEKVG